MQNLKLQVKTELFAEYKYLSSNWKLKGMNSEWYTYVVAFCSIDVQPS